MPRPYGRRPISSVDPLMPPNTNMSFSACNRSPRLGGAFGPGTVSDKLQTAYLTDDPRLLSLTPRTSSPQCCGGFPNCTCGTGVSAKSAIPAPRWRSPSWVRRPSSGTLVEAYKYLESNAQVGL